MKQSIVAFERFLPDFCMELHQLLNSGLTGVDSLEYILSNEPDPEPAEMLRQAIRSMEEEGASLSEALKATGRFPAYFDSMISLGEQTGRIEEVLLALHRHYVRKRNLESSLSNSLTMPVILLLVMLAVQVLLVTRILPVFERVLGQLGVQLEGAARLMVNLGSVLSRAETWIFGVLILLLAAAIVVWLVPELRARLFQFMIRHVGNRGVVKTLMQARFSSAMAMSVASGMDLEDAVELSARIYGDSAEADGMAKKCIELLRGGAKATDAIAGCGLLDERDTRILKLASFTGSMPDMMETLAQQKEQESLERLERLTGAVEPAIILVSCGMIGVMLLSVMFPMMGLLTGMG